MALGRYCRPRGRSPSTPGNYAPSLETPSTIRSQVSIELKSRQGEGIRSSDGNKRRKLLYATRKFQRRVLPRRRRRATKMKSWSVRAGTRGRRGRPVLKRNSISLKSSLGKLLPSCQNVCGGSMINHWRTNLSREIRIFGRDSPKTLMSIVLSGLHLLQLPTSP